MRTARWQCRSLGASSGPGEDGRYSPPPPTPRPLGEQWRSQAGPPRGGTWGPLYRPHPVAAFRPHPVAAFGSARGSMVGKLRAPGSTPHAARKVWAGRRLRVLFVCDYWEARVEASSCLHVRVCARWATPGYQCARVHVSMLARCGHVHVHACVRLECCGLGDAHGSGVPVPVSLCTRANAGPTVGDPPHSKRPCREAQPRLRLSE